MAKPRRTCLVSAPLLLLCIAWTAQAADLWRPINPEDLALKTPSVEKDADAEALFWEVRLDDAQTDQTVLKHHLRMKIFTARGVESQSRIDLPYGPRQKIVDIVARTVKPDGTVVELKRDAVFERTIIEAGVDELPDPVKLQTDFGAYSANHTVEDGDLIFTRSLTLRRSILPIEQCGSVRRFYESILAVEQAPAVLIRK